MDQFLNLREKNTTKTKTAKKKGQKTTTDITNTKANSYEEIQKLEMQNKVE